MKRSWGFSFFEWDLCAFASIIVVSPSLLILMFWIYPSTAYCSPFCLDLEQWRFQPEISGGAILYDFMSPSKKLEVADYDKQQTSKICYGLHFECQQGAEILFQIHFTCFSAQRNTKKIGRASCRERV